MERPSLGSLLFGVVPFAASCLSVSLWDRVYPMVLGLPFNFFWLLLWMLLTPLFMYGAYRIESRRHETDRPEGGAR